MSNPKSLNIENRWQEQHDYLKENHPGEFRRTIKEICNELGCHYTAYNRYIKDPGELNNAFKKAIAQVYFMPPHFLFPEYKPITGVNRRKVRTARKEIFHQLAV